MVLWRPTKPSRTNTKKDVLFIIGAWNAKVRIQEIPGVTGKFGLGVKNEAGQRLIEFCQENVLDIEQWTGSKLGKEYIKAIYCHPAYLSYMQSTSCKMWVWLKHKMESKLPGEIPVTSDMQMTSPSWQRGTKELLDESERGEWKSWLKTQHSEN